MPELPEIYNLSLQMHSEFKEKTITGVQVVQEKCLNMPAADFINMLTGRRVEQVTSRGKWIFAGLDREVWLLISLGMGGDAFLHEKDSPLPEKYQVRLDFHDGRVLTIRFWWFGYVHAVPGRALAGHKMTAGLGPTPLRDDNFSRALFMGLLKGRKGSVKSFLLNQNNIAGIGNVYIQDTLFRAGIHPGRKLTSLTDEDRTRLYSSMLETVQEAAKLGGLAYEKDLYGRPGGFKDFLVGYREGQACPRCRSVIQKIKTGSTSSYICPRCQVL
jgi:formamidopyrimidine-DNA glycosylase